MEARTDLEHVFEEQLARCRTDYFDFYLLHSVQEQFFDAYMDPARDYIGYLLKQKAAGRIRYLGFSSHAAPAGHCRLQRRVRRALLLLPLLLSGLSCRP